MNTSSNGDSMAEPDSHSPPLLLQNDWPEIYQKYRSELVMLHTLIYGVTREMSNFHETGRIRAVDTAVFIVL